MLRAVRLMVFAADKLADVVLLCEKNIVPWLISSNQLGIDYHSGLTHISLIPISLDALSITFRDSPFAKLSTTFLFEYKQLSL
jgi:hypothetical protein